MSVPNKLPARPFPVVPPPPPPEATGVVPIFQRRRTLIEDPHGAAIQSAESVVTSSMLQGALFTCAGITLWAAYDIATSSSNAPRWLGFAAALLGVALVVFAIRAGRTASIIAQRLTATGSEPRHAEVAASREGKRDLVIVRFAAVLAPAYAIFGIAKIQTASLPLLAAAVLFCVAAVTFARRTADRLGNARYATRAVGFREDRAS